MKKLALSILTVLLPLFIISIMRVGAQNESQSKLKDCENPFSYNLYWMTGEKYLLVESEQFLEENWDDIWWNRVDMERVEKMDTIVFIDSLGNPLKSNIGEIAEVIGKGGITNLFLYQKKRIIEFPEESKVEWEWLPVKKYYKSIYLAEPNGNKITMRFQRDIFLDSEQKWWTWTIWATLILTILGLGIKDNYFLVLQGNYRFSWGSSGLFLVCSLLCLLGASVQANNNDPIGAYMNLYGSGGSAILYFLLGRIYFNPLNKKSKRKQEQKENELLTNMGD